MNRHAKRVVFVCSTDDIFEELVDDYIYLRLQLGESVDLLILSFLLLRLDELL